jgi:hypothetical protein
MEMKKRPCKKIRSTSEIQDANAKDGSPATDKPWLAGSTENMVTRIPLDVATSLDRACKTGKWLIAVFHVDHDKLILDRTAMSFPVADLELACRLFVENVQRLKS